MTRRTTATLSGLGRSLFLAALCVSSLPVLPGGAAASAAGSSSETARVSLRVDSSASVERRGVVRIDVIIDAPGDATAFEATATLARGAGRIVGADTRTTAMDDPDRRDLSVADIGNIATLASYSTSGSALPDGDAVGSFYVRVRRAGQIEVRLGTVELARADGSIVPSTTGQPEVIDVLGRHDRHVDKAFAAPDVPWTMTESGSRQRRDVADVELEWQERHVANRPCATRSARRAGGCLTISDVQVQATDGTLAPASTGSTRAGKTFVVRSRGDEPDARAGNGTCATSAGTCTLRAAIQESNALDGSDTIAFDLSGTSPYRIQLTDRLPGLWGGGTIIDGYTQPGSSRNTSANRFNGQVLVEIVGKGATAFDGMAVTSGGNRIQGLSFHDLRRSIWIFRAGRTAAANVIRGNLIGTDPSGTDYSPSEVDLAHGIHIEQDSANTIIGGPDPADRNVISGNARSGVGIWHMGSDNTVVQGNLIGLSPNGTPLPNWKHGVDLNFGASNSLVGGLNTGEGNVISSNRGSAVEISHTSDTTNNRIVGNIMGADVTGSGGGSSYGSGDAGIRVEDGVRNNIIRRNVIVNSARGGIRITNVGLNGPTLGTVIWENWIGVSPDGVSLPNKQVGLSLDGSDTTVGPDNRIERNVGPGVTISELDAQHNTVTRNRITGNSGLAIDIAPLGSANINDAGDTDTGPNGLLNAPVITSVTDATIRGRACPGCRVELFTTGASSSGHGPLDRLRVALDADSNGVFQGANDSIPLGSWVTATATDPSGNTSEPSWNVLSASSNTQPVANAGSDRNVDEGASITLTASAQDADGDGLRYAWDLNDDGTFEALGRSVTYRAPRVAPATVPVTVEVVDDRGGIDRDTAVLTIVDAPDPLYPPVGRTSAPAEVTEARRIPLGISAVRDPDSPTVPVGIAFDCGSGFGSFGSSTSTSCPAQPVGLATLGVRLRDDEGTVTTYPVRVIVHDNRVVNSSFEEGTTAATGWSHPNTLARTTNLSHDGAASIATTTATTALLRQTFDVPSTRLQTSAWVSISGSGSVTSQVRWYDGAGTLISTTTVASRSGDSGGWVRLDRILDAPGAARRAGIEFKIQTSTGARVAVDDVSFTYGTLLNRGGLDDDSNGDGLPDGWWQLSRFTSTTESVLSGARSGRAASDGTSFTPGQAVDRVSAGAVYHVSGWFDIPSDTDVTVRLSIRWLRSDGTSIALVELASRAGATPSWTQLAGSATAPTGATKANLEVRLAGLRGTMYLDQFALARA